MPTYDQQMNQSRCVCLCVFVCVCVCVCVDHTRSFHELYLLFAVLTAVHTRRDDLASCAQTHLSQVQHLSRADKVPSNLTQLNSSMRVFTNAWRDLYYRCVCECVCVCVCEREMY
jgi:hypothetical protein